jgi:hypothetical protein
VLSVRLFITEGFDTRRLEDAKALLDESLGVAMVDMDTDAPAIEIIWHTCRLGINPGGAGAMTQRDDRSPSRIAGELHR